MPGLYRDEGIVLRTIKLGEADRIVTLFTRDNGKVRAVAKGVRKTKSRFGGRLEPYNRLDLLVYRGRKDLDTITGADIIEPNSGLHRDFTRLATAAVMAEFVEKIVPDREPIPEVYSLLSAGLAALGRGLGPTVLPAFMVKLLSVSGFNPELDGCAGCGDEGFLGGFSPALGGAVCKSCWLDDPDAIGLAPDRLQAIAALLASDLGHPLDPELVDEVTQLLKSYSEYHLERPLKSLQLLRAV
jgi:DNA repair protein RecO (recombination protein O)